MTLYRKNTGNEGENIAADLLKKKNYKIIKRNYRSGKGEVDIIAQDGDTLVFVEVKSRRNLEYGMPVYAVTKAKQMQLKKIAEAFISENNIKDTDCRIDVVTVLFRKNASPEIDHIINAF
ncbi:MAG: YraN family protein [Melioribacteraceae bacterium]|nr:YraN family protein [Melioribacteraceae bacterium]